MNKETPSTQEISGFHVEVSDVELIDRIGYSIDTKPSKRTLKQVKKAIEKVCEIGKPRALYKIFPVHTDKKSVHLGSETTLSGKRLTHVLSNCEKAAVFVVTLGPEIDHIISKDMENSPSTGIILDIAGSLAAESAAQYIEDTIARSTQEDHDITMRYSPGYCDWPLEEQERLFSVLPADPAEVALSSECLMQPRKSVSGIIGIGPAKTIRECSNACAKCPRTNCPHRRI
ncbi:MAG: vitamin B12 dependent-methionine synthase activation domain-containing protein [Thermodesulfobacteriota bacterium]|nr:vitamin B12 dependent-methionine synthase activation domain-containing protein [Thermodesulfobacteriota bacterium]